MSTIDGAAINLSDHACSVGNALAEGRVQCPYAPTHGTPRAAGIMQIYRVQLSGVSTMHIVLRTLRGVYQGACKSQWTFLGYVTYVGIDRMGS
jgi:hypothetical protein